MFAHVRGSQMLGRPWYEAGKLLTKKNTFNDFVDVWFPPTDESRRVLAQQMLRLTRKRQCRLPLIPLLPEQNQPSRKMLNAQDGEGLSSPERELLVRFRDMSRRQQNALLALLANEQA